MPSSSSLSPRGCALASLILATVPAASITPVLDSWTTSTAGTTALVRETNGGTPVSTWPSSGLPNMGGGVATASRADIQQIRYSSSFVYISANGLASYIMGPWYSDAADTQIFGNWPAVQTSIHKLPRTPVPATSLTRDRVGLGPVGVMVNGVALFNGLDAFSYNTSLGTDRPGQGPNPGGGIWNRSAIAAEIITFDPAQAHQPGNGQYHFHANPVGLRYQLGDHMTYNSGTNTFAEAATAPQHSPILGWAHDGYPIYGPYGYSSANNAASGIRRMISGYTERNGTSGTTNLASTGRTTIPAWAGRVYSISTTLSAGQFGPAVNSSFPLGWYAEDHDFLGDLGFTQGTHFDLDEYNGRNCVTPEFPGGTYAYFVTIDATGTPKYPFTLGAQYYGDKLGGTVTTISEAVTTYFQYVAPAANVTKWVDYEGGQIR